MSILTEREIAYIAGAESRNFMEFARAIESAVLAKLAGMDLPEPETFKTWNAKQHVDPEEIGFLQALRIAYCCGQDSVNQKQAYAQGAASQLSQVPFGWITSESAYMLNKHGGNESRGTVPVHAKKSAISVIPLYTLKEAK